MIIAGFPVSRPTNLVNTFGLSDNCYYCTVAALYGMTTQQLFQATELMQNAGGASLSTAVSLMQGLEGRQGTNRQILSAIVTQDTQNHFANDGQAFFGLGYDRNNGTSHMVVLFVRLEGLTRQLQCLDYQSAKVLEFPPETNIRTYHIIGIAPDIGNSQRPSLIIP